MAIPEQQTYRTTAEPGKAAQTRSWYVRVDRFWPESVDVVVLVAHYDRPHIDAIVEEQWKGCLQGQMLEGIRASLLDDPDHETERYLRRAVAGATFTSKVASGKLLVPREVTWLISDEESTRDLMVVNAGPYLEIWSARAWRDVMRAQAPNDGGAA